MDFRYGTAFAVPPPEAYERLLLDVMLGDPTLLHPHRRGRERLAVHHVDPRRLATARCPAAGHLRRRQLGARGRRCLDRRRQARAGGGSEGRARPRQMALVRRPLMPDARPTPFSKAKESRSSFATSRPSWPSSGGRRPSRSAARSSRTHTSRASCWPTWWSSAWTATVESLGPVLETVIARFPCRAIVLCWGRTIPSAEIAAEVSALCHLPAPGLPQVCSERIVLRAGPNAVDLVPGAVRSLLEADLPMVLWWTGDPRKHERALPRPGRRVLAAGPRPARPRRGARRRSAWASTRPSARAAATAPGSA